MKEPTVIALVFILVGAFSMIASITNWEYYFTHRKAKFIVKTFGRNGARIFYLVLGIGLCGSGIYKMM